MLENKLYTIQSIKDEGGEIEATLLIDRNHPVFAGHFPGRPVLPGVCMMQIVKEILEKSRNTCLILSEAQNAKFLSLIDPNVTSTVQATVQYTAGTEGQFEIIASLHSGEQVFFKYKAVFLPQSSIMRN